MALVHERFYQAEELTEINFREYIEKLCRYIFQSYGDATNRINVVIEADPVLLDMDTAMPCGLLVNEIVSNAYKYGFPGNKKGEIKISLQKVENLISLDISDNGVGLPAEFNIENTESLGMQLIQALTSQLDGALTVNHENGTGFRVQFIYPRGKAAGIELSQANEKEKQN